MSDCPHRNAHSALIDVPMPRDIARLKRDHRGYPVPYVVIQDPPSLAVIDPQRLRDCAQRKLCGVCGLKLGNKKWFVGGENSAKYRLFIFGAQHEECARYAIRVCPFIIMPKMQYSKAPLGPNQSINPHVVTTRPEFFYLLRTNGYKSEIRDGQRYLKANPWDYLEGWKNGQACGGPITLQSLNVSSQFSVDPRKYYQSANFN